MSEPKSLTFECRGNFRTVPVQLGYLKVEGSTPGLRQLAQVVEADDPELQSLVSELRGAMGA